MNASAKLSSHGSDCAPAWKPPKPKSATGARRRSRITKFPSTSASSMSFPPRCREKSRSTKSANSKSKRTACSPSQKRQRPELASRRAGNHCAAGHSDDSDVILLPESLRSLDDLSGGFHRNFPRSLESEEFAIGPLRFNHPIGIKRETTARIQLELGCLIHSGTCHSEWQRPGKLHFPPVEIG